MEPWLNEWFSEAIAAESLGRDIVLVLVLLLVLACVLLGLAWRSSDGCCWSRAWERGERLLSGADTFVGDKDDWRAFEWLLLLELDSLLFELDPSRFATSSCRRRAI